MSTSMILHQCSTLFLKGGITMKKPYISPELDVTKINLSELMTNINISNPEETRQSGEFESGEDIGG